MTQNRRHVCDTEDPQRPCCWAARNAEMTEMLRNDNARIARYGSQSCTDCGEVYSAIDGVALDHTCKPMAMRGFAAQGID